MHWIDKALPPAMVAAWVVNDLEEWFTMAPWTARNAELIRSLPLRVPWEHGGMPVRQSHIAIGIVGAGITCAAVQGVRTMRRSRLFRASLLAFGLHGFAHIGQSIILRQYTPGVITGATVVIPFWLWAEVTRRSAGDERYTRGEIVAALAMLAALPVVVGAAGRILAKTHTENS